MRPYRLTRAADADLDAIWCYVAESASVQAADTLETKLHQRMMQLAGSPGMGHARADLGDDRLRVFAVHNILIIYMADEPLVVIRVLHGARNVAAVLHGRIHTE